MPGDHIPLDQAQERNCFKASFNRDYNVLWLYSTAASRKIPEVGRTATVPNKFLPANLRAVRRSDSHGQRLWQAQEL